MIFNEDSRVKIPAILHLIRLGYKYLSLKDAMWDKETNIFPNLFSNAISRINPEIDEQTSTRLLEDIKLSLDNEDLGRAFYEKLIEQSGIKLIDLENPSNNTFHVVTELSYKNGDDEFRPDITLLINGMPLIFLEVKKPNNQDGILAERKRIEIRCQNTKFRRFINITQLMVFSNNMEYVDGSPEPIEGAFYASTSYTAPIFNYFREEEELDLNVLLHEEEDAIENKVLQDNNLSAIKYSSEFLSNKSPSTPTNRICTSLLSRDRLFFLLQYALAYVQIKNAQHKHVMRYPQMFATKAIENSLNADIRKGIVWHTQGSGKTALAYYNTRFLTAYFQKRNITPKFYFIVDRLDLLIQAAQEFRSRGLIVYTIDSREEFAREIKKTQAIHNNAGKPEITVVNIQKFQDDPDVLRTEDYDISIQRVYFLDEVHRSYNPKGSFLANLCQSDRNAIQIGLTGTPLLGSDYNSRALFGNYVHKYYYNASIADGYTLRLIREEIASQYKISLQQALADIQLKEGDIERQALYSHPRFVKPMLDYILEDFTKSRKALNDQTIGSMVICDSSEQAKEMFKNFEARSSEMRGALILHDIGSKEDRKNWVDSFKGGNIDILFVYNMLLTGFDAPRLKKLYLGRIVRKHNLLQTLTRVNRPHNKSRYGYVVDFADIRKEFEATNQAYFEELQEELGDELEHYSHLFKSAEEITQEIEQIKDALFRFNIENAEVFSQQISQIQDRPDVLSIKKALANARSLYNLIRLQGNYPLLEQLDFQKINQLYHETSRHLDLLNLKESLESKSDNTNLLNQALEDVVFLFSKIKEEELAIADQLKSSLQKTRETLLNNFDQQDPSFISLKEELERLFKKKKLNEVTQADMDENITALNAIQEKAKELNRQNDLLKEKYQGDTKYARIHKRLLEKDNLSLSDRQCFISLSSIKNRADGKILQNSQLLSHDAYFEKMMMPLIVEEFQKSGHIKLNPDTFRAINHLVVNEYVSEYKTGNTLGIRR